MTQDEIIWQNEVLEITKQAGIDEWWDSGNEQREILQEHLEAFYKLVVAKEREACAILVESEWSTKLEKILCDELAAYIRERGEA